MLPGPVFNVELLTTARRARYFVVRFLYGAILLLIFWENNPRLYPYAYPRSNSNGELSIAQMSALAHAVFMSFAVCQSIAVLFLTPALVAPVIADEKQRKTLHYLLASDLSSAEIVLGKLAARLLHLGVFVAVGLPVMALISLIGGVDPNEVLLLFGGTITSVFFLAALSILVSTYARKPREAITQAYMLGVFWLFGPAFIALINTWGGVFWLDLYHWIRPINDWVGATSPFYILITGNLLMGGAGPRTLLDSYFWMVGLQTGVGALFVVWSLARLRPVFQKQGDSPRWASRLKALTRGKRFLPRPACGDDAMLWKEMYTARTGPLAKVVAATLALLVTVGIGYGTLYYAVPAFGELLANGYGSSGYSSERSSLNMYIRIVGGLLYVALALGIAGAAAGGLAHEREEDTWISLIATPLEGFQILRAKMVGAFWGLRWLAFGLVALWTIGLFAGAVHPIGYADTIIETAIFLWFVNALGTYCSLTARSTTRALVLTVGILIALNGGYMICCIPMQTNTTFILVGVTPVLSSMAYCTYDEFGSIFGFNSSYSQRWGESVMACMVGTIGYAFGALVLTIQAFNQFDRQADRPRRTWAAPLPSWKPAPRGKSGVSEL